VVSVINFKGGVGKTTLTANLGAELASRGYKVLLIDLDPQSSLTFSFVPPDEWKATLSPSGTIKNWFDAERNGIDVNLASLVVAPDLVKPAIAGNNGTLDLLPSHLDLINIDLELGASLGGGSFGQVQHNFMRVYRKLADALRQQRFKSYDVVMIDCAPNFNVLNKSAVVASDWVLVPTRPDYLSILGLEYLKSQLLRFASDYKNFAKIRAAGEPSFPRISPRILGAVFQVVQYYGGKPVQAHQTFIDEVKNNRELDILVFDQVVRQSPGLFATAPRDGIPVAVRSSAPSEIAQELDALADEFIIRADLGKA
jgi:chromosome partitioning protein